MQVLARPGGTYGGIGTLHIVNEMGCFDHPRIEDGERRGSQSSVR